MKAGYFRRPPQSLSKETLSFDYRNPLAAAQDSTEVQAILRMLETAGALVAFDPTVTDRIPAHNLLKRVARNYGLPANILESDETVEEAGRARAEQEAAAQETDAALAAAQALRDGGQGAAALINAGQE